GLAERHLPRPDHVDLGLVDVVDADAKTAVREGEGERKADVAAAADDDSVEVLHGGQIMLPPAHELTSEGRRSPVRAAGHEAAAGAQRLARRGRLRAGTAERADQGGF